MWRSLRRVGCETTGGLFQVPVSELSFTYCFVGGGGGLFDMETFVTKQMGSIGWKDAGPLPSHRLALGSFQHAGVSCSTIRSLCWLRSLQGEGNAVSYSQESKMWWTERRPRAATNATIRVKEMSSCWGTLVKEYCELTEVTKSEILSAVGWFWLLFKTAFLSFYIGMYVGKERSWF